MKKFVLAAVAGTMILAMQAPSQAAGTWTDIKLKKMGMAITVNNTFKVSKETSDEADLAGTIYKVPAAVVLLRDASMDWSAVKKKDLNKEIVKHFGKGMKLTKATPVTINGMDGSEIGLAGGEGKKKTMGAIFYAVVKKKLVVSIMACQYTKDADRVAQTADTMFHSLKMTRK